MNKCFFVMCVCLLFCFSSGCVLENDSDQNGTTTEVTLKSYSDIDHTFLNHVIDTFRTTDNTDGASDQLLQGEVSAAFKIIGKVAQLAKKVHSKEATKNWHSSVNDDVAEITEDLEKLDSKITDGFNKIFGEFDEASFDGVWDLLVSNDFDPIDAAWGHYLDPNGRRGLLNILSNSNATEDYENAVSDFNATMSSMQFDIEIALTGIQNSITVQNIRPTILNLYVTALSSNNGITFDSEDTMNDVMTQYVYMYSHLLLYQIKALILLDEYYNLQIADENDSISLNATGYTTVMSQKAMNLNADAIDELQKQLVPLLYNGERLISQFNSGDIYRKYEENAPAIRNSDYYPYIDSYIKTFYGECSGPLFVFRLVWSDEAATNDPDAVMAGEEVIGDYNHNYEDLFDDLKNSGKGLNVVLSDDNGIDYEPVINANDSKNLTGISTFTLHHQDTVDSGINAGLRRFVFMNIPNDTPIHLGYTSDLTEFYTFKYTPNSKYFDFNLYDPGTVDFSIPDLLAENNPLEDTNYDYKCVSYTFGAYLAEFEYKDIQLNASNLYNTSSDTKYFITSTLAYLETDSDEHPAKISIRSQGVPLEEGMKATLAGFDMEDNYTYFFGVLRYKSGSIFRATGHKDDFTLKKKYIFPSGKLFSDNLIKKYTYFMLTKDDLWMHHMAKKHDYRLELSEDGPFNMKTWFFLDGE